MRIDYEDKGTVATMTITSTVFELRRHNRTVDKVLFQESGIIHTRSGLFRLNTVFSGASNRMLRAYKIALQEASR